MFWMLLVFGLQIGALAALVLWSAFSKAYYLFFTVLSIIMGVIIITRKENSAYRYIRRRSYDIDIRVIKYMVQPQQ